MKDIEMAGNSFGRGEQGEQGIQGDKGIKGDQGIQGERYSSWLTRHILTAYSFICVGIVLGFLATGIAFHTANNRIEERFRRGCEAGNIRSQLQIDNYRESAIQLQQIDLKTLINISSEQAEALRRLTIESANSRILATPFLDCQTGKRLSTTPDTIPIS